MGKPAVRNSQDAQQYLLRKRTAENTPRNTDFITRAVGSQTPEIRPVEWLNFRPLLKHADGAEYSDRINTDNEIKDTSRLLIKKL